jgi:hypothetical protein
MRNTLNIIDIKTYIITSKNLRTTFTKINNSEQKNVTNLFSNFLNVSCTITTHIYSQPQKRATAVSYVWKTNYMNKTTKYRNKKTRKKLQKYITYT